jgi:hypothetical protein
MGHTQIMVMKIFWDWAIYWSIPCVLFTNNTFTDLMMLKKLFASENSVGQRFEKLNKVMQDMFLDWRHKEHAVFSNHYIDPFDVRYLREFQEGIEVQHGKNIVAQIEKNLLVLEKVAAEIFRLVSNQTNCTPSDMLVNPYAISLSDEADMSLHENGLAPDESIAIDVDTMWFYNKEVLFQEA